MFNGSRTVESFRQAFGPGLFKLAVGTLEFFGGTQNRGQNRGHLPPGGEHKASQSRVNALLSQSPK